MRADLGMSKGKVAAQAGHAAVSAAEEARKRWLNWWKAWLKEGQCNIGPAPSQEVDKITGKLALL